MRILVIGSEKNLSEATSRLGVSHVIDHLAYPVDQDYDYDILFDFRIHTSPKDCSLYAGVPYLFLNTAQVTLSALYDVGKKHWSGHRFGFNGLPTFILNQQLEVCVLGDAEVPLLEEVCANLQIGFTLVKDQPGMVTPRILSMIINEAYCTLAEGTASRSDIDLAMKLGTNYPYGPFEWCERIGAAEVCQVLDGIFKATQDPRFRINPLLLEESGLRPDF
jgi:3-hydroxybutyryl-CoA dehydrogenase